MQWVARYERAWREGDPDGVPLLFTENARYRRSPYWEPDVGHAAIQAFWREDEGTPFTVTGVAVDGLRDQLTGRIQRGASITLPAFGAVVLERN